MSHVPTEEEIENEIINLAPGKGVKPLNILTDHIVKNFLFHIYFQEENLDTVLNEISAKPL